MTFTKAHPRIPVPRCKRLRAEDNNGPDPFDPRNPAPHYPAASVDIFTNRGEDIITKSRGELLLQ
jgi:hypothetical protein